MTKANTSARAMTASADDLANELEKHRGRWVAVFQDHIIAAGDTAQEVVDEAEKQGYTDPLIYRVPQHADRASFY